MALIREISEQNEHLIFSPSAAFSDSSLGRAVPEKLCDIRTCYQRDRDRVIHSNAFSRLRHKTQVFLSPEPDHYRTRLTHTLEVSQIARTISVGLRLNETLTEAIALAHDLGHTPFGHAGERTLNELMPGGFRHYENGVRVCSFIEKEGKGLNLTREVLNGILCHTSGEQAFTLEGRVVRVADRIAFINHDIEDAVRAGAISEDTIPLYIRNILGGSKSERINTLVLSCINSSISDIALDEEIEGAFDDLTRFMFDMVYTNPFCKSEEIKAETMLRQLFSFFTEHPDAMPNFYMETALREGTQRAVCDYVSGMTDTYAVHLFKKYFIPDFWSFK